MVVKKVGDYDVCISQFFLNDNQQVSILGCDFDENKVALDHKMFSNLVEMNSMGKLNDLNFIFRQQIINSLVLDNWDFDQFPNPEIVLITAKKLN